MHDNFYRIHQITRVTPAMAAGVADMLWQPTDIVKMVDAWKQGQLEASTRDFGGWMAWCETARNWILRLL